MKFYNVGLKVSIGFTNHKINIIFMYLISSIFIILSMKPVLIITILINTIS